MKAVKILLLVPAVLLLTTCGHKDNKLLLRIKRQPSNDYLAGIPLDRGFSRYITGYTSGIVSSNSPVTIQFTREFASKADKSATGLFVFDPPVKGKTAWKDETTLVFTPSGLLDAGKTYTGGLDLGRLAAVEERLKVFPLRFRTLQKDFSVTAGALECDSARGDSYNLRGEISVSDYIEPAKVENCLRAKLGKKRLEITWDHTENLVHKFTVSGIGRSSSSGKLNLSWDGSPLGVGRKGSADINIPPSGEFSVLEVMRSPGENQKIELVFSDPLDASLETEGLIHLSPQADAAISISSNIVTLLPAYRLQGKVSVNVEASLRSSKGATLSSSFTKELDFTPVPPGIKTEGNGVILPSSRNLIFPFRAVNLKAVDLRIIRIFDNDLPYFLQENDLNGSSSIKRFGRPVYSGRVDLVNNPGMNTGSWNLYSVDLADYIRAEPGVLYKVTLGMRRSYSLYPCDSTGSNSRYDELVRQSEAQSDAFWDDPDNYYSDPGEELYYSMNFDWRDRNNPCSEAYYYPERGGSRNILASNLGILVKKGEDNILHVFTSDLITALPLNGVSIDVFDFQMQSIISGTTEKNGSVSLLCDRKPFLVMAKKDRDRNFLKVNDGSSLSLSSFDVTGTAPEAGIKAFVYGERDVWRPGDSIFLSIFIRDMISDLPAGHPVQFELVSPREQKIDNQVQKTGRSNLLVFATKTPPDAPTGNYRAVFKIGGATFTKRVRIETVKPNRLKIRLTFPSEILGGHQPVSTGTLSVSWLNGSEAKNLKSSVEYLLKHTRTEFEKFRQYNFDDPAGEFYSESVRIFDGNIDENGNAKIIFDPGKELNAPGMLNAVFTVRTAEPGGDESIIQTIYKYAPYKVFAGINFPGLKGKERMLFTDRDNEMRIVTVDENGNPVSSEAEITFYKISYRWWWESDNENLGSYISNNEYKPVIKKTIATSGGKGSFSFNIGKKDWGRYLIRVTLPSGHSTGKILLVDWPWDYGMKGNSDGATLLSVSTDKEKYKPGDEVRLSFPAPENSRAIITLENSTGVLDEIMAAASGGNTVVSFRARPEMAPNIYASVTVIQPHAQTVNDMPIRLYGIAPVMVEDPQTRLSPVIVMPDELRSQKPFTVRISETNRKPMSYTLAVVDEGLLDLTGYRTPDPWNYFYAREALGVKTWDIYDYVLGAYGGTLGKIFAIGGDEALTDKSVNKARRFEPVVSFFGPFVLGPGMVSNHVITLPRYTGSVRVMAVAGSDKSFGMAEKSVTVKDPLMILVTAPRVVSPGEKVSLPVTLFIQKEGIRDVAIKAEAGDLLNFDVNTMNLSVPGPGEKDAELTFTAGEKTGTADITVTATGGGETATFSMSLEVRSPEPPQTWSEFKVLPKGEKWETTFRPAGIWGTNSAVLEVSALPSVNLEKRMDYLLNYPYGCSEQVVSSAFPQLWIRDITGTTTVSENAPANIKDAINKIVSRQMADGGIAMWPGSMQADNWITSYAGHFMTEAERNGYSIPSGFKQKWVTFQKKTAGGWRFDPRFKQSATDQAYRLFTLALEGEPDKGAMNRLRETKDIPQLSRWLLAAAFAETGRPEAASALLDVRNTSVEPEYSGSYYGSGIRDRAIILYTLILLKDEEQAFSLLKEICNDLEGEDWYSTQSTSWALLSWMKWATGIKADKNSPALIRVTSNGSQWDQPLYRNQVWSKDLVMINGNNTLTVQNGSDMPVYVNLVRKGTPLKPDITREEKGLTMKVEYLGMNLKPLDQKNLVQGSDLIMVVRVTNNTFSTVENIALTQMVPSGWEIRNTRLFETVTGIRESSYDYRDFRDDRVNTYFTLGSGETKTFELLINAAYKGEFYQPSIWCEAMYRPGCYSRIPGGQVKVTGRKIE